MHFSLSHWLISPLVMCFGHWIGHCTYYIFTVLSLKQDFLDIKFVFVHMGNNKYKLSGIKIKGED